LSSYGLPEIVPGCHGWFVIGLWYSALLVEAQPGWEIEIKALPKPAAGKQLQKKWKDGGSKWLLFVLSAITRSSSMRMR